jgi:hypothetical protein
MNSEDALESEKVVYEELVEFLRDKKKEVRLAAVEGIASLSASTEKHKLLRGTNVIKYLVRMVGDDDGQISRAVMSSLINFAAEPQFLDQMLNNHVVSRIMDGLLDLDNKVRELYAILLVNVTQQVKGVHKIIQKGDTLEGYYLSKLIELFCTHDDKKEKEDAFSWIASVLNNVTQVREGRDLILEKRVVFLKLFVYIQHPNKIRQRGILGVIRNCLFDSRTHEWLLSDDVDILSKLLLPLRGPEVYDEDDTQRLPKLLQHASKDKEREKDLESKAMIIDALLLLASTMDGRTKMRAKNIYVIVRDYDQLEDNETISENLVSLITLLKGLDEDEEKPANVNPLEIALEHPAEEIKVSPKNLEEASKETTQKRVKVDLDENGEAIEEI